MLSDNTVCKFLKNVDIFGEPVPSFKISGKGSIKTFTGALISMTIIFLTITFGLIKLQHLLQRKNPTMISNMAPLEAGQEYSTAQDEFMIATVAENYNTGDGISDPRYVRWVTAYWQRINGELTRKYYPMYKCLDEDFARFKTPENN